MSNPITVHEFGNQHGPDLVLLHGLTEAGTAWPDATARWGDRWHILAPDQRGHGRSPRLTPTQFETPIDTWVDDLTNLLIALSHPTVIVGHSLGGRVATLTASARPDLVRALLLEDPALADMNVPSPGFAAENLAFLSMFDHGTDRQVQRMLADSSWSPAEIDAWAQCKPLVDRDIFDHLNLGPLDAPAVLNRLPMPTMIIWDADGPLAIDPAHITNPHVRCEYIDDVGHCVRRDNPHAFHALADPWLAALP